jgi:(p)ppGpp synthase/HD superfamily hydrolase
MTEPRPLTERFDEALVLASNLHRHQARKGGDIPYIAHPMAVCATVLEYGGGEDEAIAALLHDGPEDQGGEATLAMIGERFGPRVKAIVAECSDTFQTPKPPWRQRKEAYIAHLETDASTSTLLVSAADKLHNVTATVSDVKVHGANLWSRFNSTAEEQLWYYSELARVYRARLGGPLSAAVNEQLLQLGAAVRGDATPRT